jgi:hypothetical protein
MLLVGRHVVFRRRLEDKVDARADRLFAQNPLLGLGGLRSGDRPDEEKGRGDAPYLRGDALLQYRCSGLQQVVHDAEVRND